MNTKRILADSLRELLGRQPLCDITVQDITAASGLSRSTFYKHFSDKYDLVGWMLPGDELYELAGSIGEASYEAVLERVLALIEEWRIVYANAIRDPYEELVYGKILEHTHGFYERAFVFDAEPEGGQVEGIIRQLAVKQVTDFLLSWVLGGVSLGKDEVLEVLTRLWPEDLFR